MSLKSSWTARKRLPSPLYSWLLTYFILGGYNRLVSCSVSISRELVTGFAGELQFLWRDI